ncbi:MAG: STAS domain-containing protein [Proteobacteria bacterium]|nr:STAS domain-containing protein [Pseudomonadota bacterium]
MGKEDTGRLLSKVAKFVRNPLKDWSELDTQESIPADNGYSREMLKEMIERRQRNDFVRRREFDMLRKLRQREAAGGTAEGAAAISSFNLSTTGKSEGRALTLKKIDEIEEQMSQQWWKGRGPAADVPGGASTGPSAPEQAPAGEEAQADRRARAYADTEPGVSPPAQQGAAGGAAPREGSIPVSLEDAAIRFAQSDDVGAEAVLLQMTAPDSPHAEHAEVWRALLDLYRATGDGEKFGAASTRYAQRLKRPGPEWVSLRSLARDAQAGFDAVSATEEAGPPAEQRRADWQSPALLAREGLAELTRSLAAAGPVWHMDWRNLKTIDHDAAAPLRALFNHWADSPVQLRFTGAYQLLDVLEKAAPTGDKSVDVVWWQLRMAVLRTVHEPDAYELASLNYCITFEVSPPSWSDPRGSYECLDRSAPPVPDYPADSSGAALVGYLGGDCKPLLQRLDAQLVHALMPIVSCAALLRVDLEGARAIIDWVAGHEEQGRRIEFVDMHRLVATFFHVVGITDHASVSIRSN